MKKKTVLIGSALAAVLVLGGAGVAVAVTEPFDNDDTLTGSTLERASKVALDEVGEGKVTDSEADDDGTYEIEVTLDDGREADVTLDDAFTVLSVERDDDTGATHEGTDDDGTNSSGSGGSDDAPLTEPERSSAEAAALAAVAGTVTDIDRSDDADHAFEVEVTRADGTEADIELSADFAVVRIDEDGVDDSVQK
ncbi:putative membrane protein YkoI [Okibacterium sp. HSC-33S16]|uniref:PepSY domain-containing protein n=1 Tax=Okibacterium sp. HSC-33S16 TaxID=2910965 RepID=UPI00209D27A6|nr:PepSY domain-containing protein [Okibacterium sp. HSC-33S16]MCP2030982.1 putative membrane protein YkoI [Okibacterium sp. HSC-33S16]